MEGVPASATAIAGLLILLPGFISLFVERSLAYERKQSGTVLVSKALVYSFLNYVVLSFARPSAISWATAGLWYEETGTPTRGGGFDALFLLLIPLAIGVAAGACKARDCHMWLARRLRLTRRTSRPGIWMDVFTRQDWGEGKRTPKRSGLYVLVFLRDGRHLWGWPEYFSDEWGDGPVLFVTNACWVVEGGENVEIPNPGIFVNGSQIEYIQFYTPQKDGNSDEQEEHGQG